MVVQDHCLDHNLPLTIKDYESLLLGAPLSFIQIHQDDMWAKSERLQRLNELIVSSCDIFKVDRVVGVVVERLGQVLLRLELVKRHIQDLVALSHALRDSIECLQRVWCVLIVEVLIDDRMNTEIWLLVVLGVFPPV